MNVLQIFKILGICLLYVLFVGCTYMSQGFPDKDRGAHTNESPDLLGDVAKEIVYPDQNWDPSDSLWFYNTTQGSNLIDYEIFLHLKAANSDMLFRSHENMQKYRYLLQNPTWDNEEGLPVGWVQNSYKGKDYIGFTCAACHTTQVNYQGTGIRIDGGPAMTDVWTMFVDLEQALQASLSDEAFSELADRILADQSIDSEKRKDLKDRVTRDYEKIRDYNKMDQPTTVVHNGIEGRSVEYGFARLDAFGRIFNRAASHLDSSNRGRPADAPVSYPHLWDTPHHDFVQWNGIADNGSAAGLGPLGRNTGEVVGVFASVDVEREEPNWLWKLIWSEKPTYSYASSVETVNQVRLEDHLKKLWSPNWEELAEKGYLPKVDQQLVMRGRKLFDSYKCGACHTHIERKDEDRLVVAQFTSVQQIGTDSTMALNALTYCGQNTEFPNLDFDMCPGKPDVVNGVTGKSAMTGISTGVLAENFLRKLVPFFETIYGNPWKDHETERHVDFEVANKGYLYAYKGRPLNGIWATAPFLHNGSVPNLYELFLPSSCDAGRVPGKTCRSNTFTVGNRELDTRSVGFVQEKDPTKRNPELFVFDTSLKGNANYGHEYAAGVTPIIKTDQDGKAILKANGQFDVEYLEPMNHDERMALVEYLKTL